MDFSLDDEQKMVQQTVRAFVNRELIPLEGDVLRNEREGKPGLEREKVRELQQKAKDMGELLGKLTDASPGSSTGESASAS